MLKNKLSKIIQLIFITGFMFCLAYMSDTVMAGIREAMVLCFSAIIPSVFPFMVFRLFLYLLLPKPLLVDSGNWQGIFWVCHLRRYLH